ncbi:hypothetical protein C0993_012270 [Termitomyces sp. T159_Od127]|nr:hypothetical protein C0993_012270 [Termitomyces sp. T159_Od127]
MSTLDDEFDNLPGDLCQFEGIDWDQILPVPLLPSADGGGLGHDAGQSPGADSSQYSCDDDDLDPTFFAELDKLEKEIVQSQQGPSSITLWLLISATPVGIVSAANVDGNGKGKACAICRTELARDTPMIPNFAMDNTVEKHVAALGKSGIIEWKVGGSKHVEWLGRKEQWRKGANERAKTRVPEKQSNQAIFVWEILDDDELGEIEYFSEDGTILQDGSQPSTSSFMHIVFHPALSENHISINDGTALVNFSATLSVADYRELERDGGRVQLWSDLPSERFPAPNGEWTSCDFRFNAAAGGSNPPSPQDFSLNPEDDEDLSSPENVILTLQILLVPPFGNGQERFSYTYRILYPSGEIRWLGEFGQNGALLCEHTTTENILGLAAGWTCQEEMYRITRTDAPVLRPVKPDEYHTWSVGSENGAFLTVLAARRNRRLVSVPPEYILCASPPSVMHVLPEKTITFTGDGALVMRSFPRRQSDLKSMILQYCSPERVAATLAGKHLLITTRNMLPVEGIAISSCSTPLSIPTDTLRSFLFPQSTSAPFLLFSPQTSGARLVSDTSTITFANPGPFVLSPAFNIRSNVYISILSPHKSAELVDTAVSNLPTPPPSPEWMPRSIMPRLDSASQLGENASAECEDSGTQDASDVNDDESASRLTLRAVASRTRCLLFFVWTVVYKLIFGMPAAESGCAEHAAGSMAPEEPEAGGLDQKNDSDGADVSRPVGSVASASKIAGKECPKVVWAEIDGSSTVRLAVCEGANGVVGAEMNGKRVCASRTNGSGTRVEFWEVAVDVGGMLRISYDHDDEDNVCV